VQANVVRGADTVVHCAGQTSVDADGNTMNEGDMAAQAAQALTNLETVLDQCGMTLANVVRLNYFVTDVDAYIANAGIVGARLAEAGCRPASTLLGVARLARPELLIEIEATAVA
jgi:enamine deaminase RidA (YjgF/YER057c/UK114 family)